MGDGLEAVVLAVLWKGMAGGFLLACSFAAPVLLRQRREIAALRDELWAHFERPEEFLADLAVAERVADSPVFGRFGRVVVKPARQEEV